MTRGSAARRREYAYSRAMLSGEVASPVVRIARASGANAPSPNSRARMSYASRDGTDGGRIVESGALNRTCRNGSPSTSSSVSVGTRTATGWRMTRRASLAHGPSAPGSAVTRRTASASIRVPRIARIAGSSVRAEATARPTTIAPAIPTERRIMNSNSTRPSRPSRTVRPEKNTARPAVATVIRTASATRSGPSRRASSSRKRLVISSE